MASVVPKHIDIALPRLPAGWQLVKVVVLADGDLAILATNVDLEQEWRRDAKGQVLGKPREVAARAEARLWCFDGARLVDGPSFLLETPFPEIDRFKDGRWLIVASRTRSEPNARLLASDGRLLARFMLGDGIGHVGVDRRGRIWVGWFDEGVFGNDEWRVPNEEWPPSSLGIGLFSADGDHQRLPAFPESVGGVADCYALNIADEEAWACPYTDFPIMHLRPGHPVRWWSNEFTGPTALAVSGSHVLLAGGYGVNADRLALVALDGNGEGEAARTVATWRLPPAPSRTLLTGRDDTIHLIRDGTWHRWRVADALAAGRKLYHPRSAL